MNINNGNNNNNNTTNSNRSKSPRGGSPRGGGSGSPRSKSIIANNSNSNNKLRSESFPLSEVEMLKQQLQQQQERIDKLKQTNKILSDECENMKKLVEEQELVVTNNSNKPSPFMVNPSFSVVKVCKKEKKKIYIHFTPKRFTKEILLRIYYVGGIFNKEGVHLA